ncbi:unnamed protein product [Knipowitschia caucasica]|uniref:Cholesterol 24-hydroxylase n=1 Tax=Knipowitschia caucasica TaxID=637954 RepID=A0AAV2K7X8_KNICA
MAIVSAGLLWSCLCYALLIFPCVCLVAFVGYCLYIKHLHLKYDHIPGPPRKSFLFGHSSILLDIMKKDGVIHDQFHEWAEMYGPVFKINILHFVILSVYSPETTKELLMSSKYSKDKFLYKRLFNLFGERFLGNGLVTSMDHDQWYKQRRIMDPAFSSLYLRGLMGTFNERAEKLMDKLTEEAENHKEAHMLHLFNCVAMDIIANAAFGVNLDLLRQSSPFPKAVEMCLRGMIYHIRDATFAFFPKNWPFINEVREACKLLRHTGAQWINKRKTAMENGENVPKDILTQIIKSAGQEESMTKEDEEFMVDNFVTFFIAGQETTANTLAFCVMELGRHPDILEKVRKEVDDVIGMKREISYEDLGHLTYLSQVLKETLRLYPPIVGTSRELAEDMLIDGIHVPGGVNCMLSTYTACRLEIFFKDPLKFDPDRFHPNAPKPHYTYYPFSLGPRSCLGKNFAEMEAKVVMAKLLQRFDFTLVPGQCLDIQDTGTLRPKGGALCTIKHRDS